MKTTFAETKLPLAIALAAALALTGCRTGDALSMWRDGAASKAELLEYVATTTNRKSPDYIPPERRIAVFDLDGTLFCETDPNYFDYTLLLHRVLEDPNYRDKASPEERETARKIVEMNRTGVSAKGLETDHGKAVASAFKGFTLEDFEAYIQSFKKEPMPGYDGMRRGDGFYLPMLQVVDYLQANGFAVWILSGTDRLIVRGIVKDSPLAVSPDHIIGSDESVVISAQGEADGLNFQLGDEDRLVLGGRFIVKNLKMNKVAAIAREIGMQPVLCFGNSNGDFSMAKYATTRNPCRSQAFMLCCDDLERENGNAEKAAKMRSLCEANGWIPISMKDDWSTIYGDGVKRRGRR